METLVMEMVAVKLKALADPLRLRIVQMLAKKEMTVTEIVEATKEKQSNTSKHLKILAQANIVAFERNQVYRRYRLTDRRSLDVCRMISEGLADELTQEVKKRDLLNAFTKKK